MKRFRYGPMKKWTPTLALRRSKCRIEDARAALLDLSGVWADIDGFVCSRIDDIREQLDVLHGEVLEAAENQIARDGEADA